MILETMSFVRKNFEIAFGTISQTLTRNFGSAKCSWQSNLESCTLDLRTQGRPRRWDKIVSFSGKCCP